MAESDWRLFCTLVRFDAVYFDLESLTAEKSWARLKDNLNAPFKLAGTLLFG